MIVALAAVVGGCVLTTGQAAAGQTRGGFVADGRRYVAYPTERGTIRVIDDAARRSFEVARPAVCGDVSAEVWPVATGGGRLLVECPAPGGPTVYAVLDIARQAWRDTVGIAALLDRYDDGAGGSASITSVGAQWVGVYAYGHRWEERAWLNWHTGAVRESDGTLQIADLDTSQLFRRPCSPSLYSSVLRHPNPGDENGAAPAFDAHSPYELVYRASVGLLAQRCGSQTVLPLESKEVSSKIAIGAGVVTWTTSIYRSGDTNPDESPQRWFARSYLLACHVRLSFELADVVGELQHTLRALYIPDPDAARGFIRRSLPRCADQPRPHRLVVVSESRHLAVSPTTMHWHVGRLTGERVGPTNPTKLPAGTGATIRLHLDAPATRVRWRNGTGRWHLAPGGRRAWTIAPPPEHWRRELSLSITYTNGHRATYTLVIESNHHRDRSRGGRLAAPATPLAPATMALPFS